MYLAFYAVEVLTKKMKIVQTMNTEYIQEGILHKNLCEKTSTRGKL